MRASWEIILGGFIYITAPPLFVYASYEKSILYHPKYEGSVTAHLRTKIKKEGTKKRYNNQSKDCCTFLFLGCI